MIAHGLVTALFVAPLLYAGLFAVILVHESGHLVAGLLLGMRLVRIRVGPFEFRRGEGLNPRPQWNGALTGAVTLRAGRRAMRGTVPRQVAVLLAGATANFCSGIAIVLVSQHGTVKALAGNLFAICSLCVAFGNLFPSRTRGFENDGYRVCSLLFSRRARSEAVIRMTLVERLREFRQLYAARALSEASTSLEAILAAFDTLPELSKQVEARSRFANLKQLIDNSANEVENVATNDHLPLAIPSVDAFSAIS